ncbi:hypothetical protein ATCC90586_010612 [Pythium insidiosum]|nr:hypothetical protein ATCC90586_010612 [Pythium insidiosum]
MLAGVRLVRLFELPAAASPTPRATTAPSPSVGRLGAFLVSERCNAVEPPRSAFDLSLPRSSPADDLTLLSISDERSVPQPTLDARAKVKVLGV